MIANKWEKLSDKQKANYGSISNYVQKSGWWAHGKSMNSRSLNTSSSTYSGSVNAAQDVFVNGNSPLPSYIDEHDCVSDISSATNNGVAINKKDRSQYIQGVTKIKNCYGATYTFYGFAPGG